MAVQGVAAFHGTNNYSRPPNKIWERPFGRRPSKRRILALVVAARRSASRLPSTCLHTGLYTRLYAGLHTRLHTRLHTGLHTRLYAGLHTGLHTELHTGREAVGLRRRISAGRRQFQRDLFAVFHKSHFASLDRLQHPTLMILPLAHPHEISRRRLGEDADTLGTADDRAEQADR